MSVNYTVAVDFDGVLASYDGWKGPDHFGEPIAGAREFLKTLKKDGFIIVINSARCCDRLEGRGEVAARDIERWLKKHGMDYHEVYAGQGKVPAAAYIDDRAVTVRPHPSKYRGGLDWTDIRRQVDRLRQGAK